MNKMVARGEFEVALAPLPTFAEGHNGVQLGRLSITKRFSGDLAADSRGEMLTAGTTVEGSAGYVAIEQVAGALHGKRGSFVLQHSGVMNRGEASLTLEVVPDSGGGELAGLKGTMQIDIREGKHFYVFEYVLG